MKRKSKKIDITINVYICISAWLIANLVLYFAIEALNKSTLIVIRHTNSHTFRQFFINYIILLMITSLAMFFKKMPFVYTLIAGFILGGAVINSVLCRVRGIPLMWGDMFIIKEGVSIADKYITLKSIILILILTVIVVGILYFTYSVNVHIGWGKRYQINFLIVILSIVNMVTIGYAKKTDTISNSGISEKEIYSENGFVYSFLDSYEDTVFEEPQNYNETTMNAIKNGIEKNKQIQTEGKKPNFVFLQVESFIDPFTIKGIHFSSDPIPNLRKYMTTTHGGTIEVPGANTARTEFEILTSMDADKISKYCIPYTNGILENKAVEALPHILKEKGYYATAIHNHEGKFYDRYENYECLGFDRFIPVEEMTGLEYSGEWPKDKILLKYIKQTLEETSQRDFIYAITVGTHSSYDKTYKNPNSIIKVTGDVEQEAVNQVQDYVDRLYETDQFIGELVNYVKGLDEETVLVVFADHIPTLMAIEKDPDFEKRKVPFFIVSNVAIPSSRNNDIKAYYLSTYVFDLVGMEGGLMHKFHHNYKNTFAYEEDLKLIEYDLLMGKSYLTDQRPLYQRTVLEPDEGLEALYQMTKEEMKLN